jgi:lipid A 4'-phosphatase
MEEAVLKRNWRIDMLVYLVLAALATALFADGRLDRMAAAAFYSPSAEQHWPLGDEMPWSLLYRMAPWITASLVLGAVCALGVAMAHRSATLRRNAILVLLSVALGPGLLVNGIFKDHWDRPRPRDVVEFGGSLHYAMAPLRGEGGKSFPCGHCSVGFLYALGWWIWRQRRPNAAVLSVVVGIAMGFALGMGRMAAGGHFLSDIVWSALIALGVAHILDRYVLDLAPSEWLRRPALAALATVSGLGVLTAVFFTPHGTLLAEHIDLASLPQTPKAFEFTARQANVEIVLVQSGEPRVAIRGELHGFGLPRSVLQARTEFDAPATLRYRIEQRGWFTDLDSAISIRLPLGALQRIMVHVESGNVRMTDATHTHAVKSGAVQLDLRTTAGAVHIDG